MVFCIIHPRNCTVGHARERSLERCETCGFNLGEYHRRIADIRENGLSDIRDGIRGYVVRKRRR